MVVQPSQRFRTPFWLWPNLLSLDAPVIAVLWQHFLSDTLSPVHPAVTIVLGLSVWLVYTADRLVDTWSPGATITSARHRFALAHRSLLAGIAIPVLGLDLTLALLYLPLLHFLAGVLLAVAVAARFYAVLRPPRRPWPKELWTAIIFATGVWAPVLLANPLRPGAILFALLCWWNCSAIDSWEEASGSRPLLGTAALLTVAALGLFAWNHRPVALAEALSAAGFCLLAAGARRFSPNLLRAAVDACLLTPLLLYAR